MSGRLIVSVARTAASAQQLVNNRTWSSSARSAIERSRGSQAANSSLVYVYRKRVRALDTPTADRLAAGGRFTVRRSVTPGADGGQLTCRGAATDAGATVTYAAGASVRLPAPLRPHQARGLSSARRPLRIRLPSQRP